MSVSVITPVWNRADLTLSFLNQNWRLYGNRSDIEFIVVDNGSEDSTPGLLKSWQERWSALTVIRNKENLGFGPGNNQGTKIASGDIFVFLSNDVVVNGDYIGPVAESLKGRGHQLIGAQLMDWDTGWNKFNGEIIPYIAGWCVACTRDVWQMLDGFDERFIPCDYEDMDLSLEASKAGITLVKLDLPLVHMFGRSAQALSGGREAITLENKKRFVEKWGFTKS